MNIIKKAEAEETVGKFIDDAFTEYAKINNVDLNYEEYWFVAEDDNSRIIGSITGRAYYNEVPIGDLIIDKNHRGQGIGAKQGKMYRGKGADHCAAGGIHAVRSQSSAAGVRGAVQETVRRGMRFGAPPQQDQEKLSYPSDLFGAAFAAGTGYQDRHPQRVL